MQRYIDGFILPIPRHRLSEYKAIAETASTVHKEYGALEYWECAGDDLNIDGVRSFTEMAGAADDETVILAWVIYESRAARDAANEKIMADPRMIELMKMDEPIFEQMRMAYGGFTELHQA